MPVAVQLQVACKADGGWWFGQPPGGGLQALGEEEQQELMSELGEDWDAIFWGARSPDCGADERWCAATVAVGVRSMLPGDGLPLVASDRCTVPGRALGSSVRSCLARHRLEPSHLISLRLVTGRGTDPAIAGPLRRAFLESLHAELAIEQLSSLRDGSDDAAEPACERQATIIAAPAAVAVSQAAPESQEVREVHVMVEIVALALR